jgi:hypothetical protein
MIGGECPMGNEYKLESLKLLSPCFSLEWSPIDIYEMQNK